MLSGSAAVTLDETLLSGLCRLWEYPLDGRSELRISFFEYISVGVAFVLSFGVVRLLDGIPHALDRKKRYWPHSLWIAIKFLNHFAI